MKSDGLWVIAQKELRDHFRSRKFLLIFGIFLIITVLGMVTGVAHYNKDLQKYNERQSVIDEDESEVRCGWQKPSIMTVYMGLSSLITIIFGAILGIAMGFDLISKEKETKSLKMLLSNPIYRDEVINGKAIGGVMALAIVIGIVFIVTFAILIISGIVPEGDELLKILVYEGATFLMILSYFALSLFMSTIANDSGTALVYSLIIFVVIICMGMAQGEIINQIIGDPPAQPEDELLLGSDLNSIKVIEERDYKIWEEYNRKSDEYQNKRQSVSDIITLFSPPKNLRMVSDKMICLGKYYPGRYNRPEVTVTDIFGDILKNIIAMIAFPALFLGLAYVRFMRMDIR
ncbi:ABC transporter permease [Methanogenium cariaci]